MKKKKILITGCIYGAGNIGDEAILEGMLRILPTDAQIGICVAGYEARYSSRGMSVFGLSNLQLLKAVFWADAVILGGASLLTDPMGPNYPIRFSARALRIAKVLGKPCQFVGIGATKLKGADALALAHRYYPLADRFLVRNTASVRAVVDQLKVPEEKVLSMCDTAFFLQGAVEKERGRALLKREGIDPSGTRPLIGVSVVNESFAEGRSYHKTIAAACDRLYHEIGARIVFIYSEIRPGAMFDQAAAESVKAHMKAPWEDLPPKFYDTLDFTAALACFDVLLPMRMHVIILGAVGGTPSAAIVREDKVVQIIDELQLKAVGTIDDLEVDKTVEYVKHLYADRERVSKKLAENVAKIVSRGSDVLQSRPLYETLPSAAIPPALVLRELTSYLASVPGRILGKVLKRRQEAA